MNNIPRIMFAATKSGSGKTLITAAFLEAMKERGKAVQAFKCGPDYIDPMFHESVLGVPSANLDTWFIDHAGVRELFAEHVYRSGAELAVIEGVMGLYDGLGGTQPEGSSYDLARALQCPIFLIIDARGMGLSMEAEIAGFLSMDTDHLIRGVILNRTSKSFCAVMKEKIEADLPVKVAGCFPQDKTLHLDSRHLGLKMPGEVASRDAMKKKSAENLRAAADVDAILSIAAGAPELKSEPESKSESKLKSEPESKSGQPKTEPVIRSEHAPGTVRIGVARDEAFCFYYDDNLRLLEKMGAELVPFSPLRDEKLPEHLSGLYLGGGYPELYARELSENTSMLREIRSAEQADFPTVAECGGFMYLHFLIRLADRRAYRLVGSIPEDCFYTGHLVRFGYMELTERTPRFLPEGARIKGHEFHYYDSGSNGTDCTAEKPVSGRSWQCVHETDHSFLGFPHLYWPSCPSFAQNFLHMC